MNLFSNFKIIIISIIYYNIVIRGQWKYLECNNYDDFQHVNFIFSQNFISLFWGLFNVETDLKVRYIILFVFIT
jgi:hypothetical protein